MTVKPNRLALLLIICFFCATAITGTVLLHQNPCKVGTLDLVGYWTTYQAAIHNQNPYSEAAIGDLQKKLGCYKEYPAMVMNTPWAFVLLTPLLAGSFLTTASLFFTGNILLWFLISFLSWRFFSDTEVEWPLTLHMIAFMPFWNNLQLGQLGGLLTFSCIAAFWCIQKKRDWLAGFCLCLMTLKPHLFYLIIPVLFIWIIRKRRWIIPISFILFFSGAALTAHVFFPNLYAQWLNMESRPMDYIPLSIVSPFRMLIRSAAGLDLGMTFSWALPLMMLIAVTLGYLKKTIDWQSDLPKLLCLSLFTTPYGWICDQTLLLIVMTAILIKIRQAPESSFKTINRILIFVNYAAVMIVMMWTFDRYLFWLPLSFLMMWRYAEKAALNRRCEE